MSTATRASLVHPAYGIGGRLMVVGGGLPVIVDGEVVGGVMVSSPTPPQDRKLLIPTWATS